jgi:hypothetical protein
MGLEGVRWIDLAQDKSASCSEDGNAPVFAMKCWEFSE